MGAMARRPPPWTLALALAAVVLWLNPRTADLAAQTYRAGLWERVGFTVWDNGWYSGHHVPAYSLLSPPLAGLLGVRLAGALACVAAALACDRLLRGVADRRAARLTSLAFALGTVTELITGRVTFALGLAFGIAALAALREGRPRLAALLAVLCAVGSPVAGIFLALCLAAWWLGDRREARVRLAVALAGLVPAGALGLLFPEGGTFPFTPSSAIPTLAAGVLVLVVVPRDQPVLRAGAWLYVALLVASALIPSPMGGNAARLGALVALPVAVAALAPARRWRLLAALALPLVYWQWAAPVDDWVRSAHDPTVTSPAYSGLKRFLRAQPGLPFRVEVPFTDNHWEASKLAPDVPLARGWERQYDREVNGLFYDGKPLTAARYRTWLDENAVRFVALAKAPIDYSAAEEAALVRAGLPYLRPVYADRVWRVWEVVRPAPMGVVALADDGFTAPAGDRVLRIRWSPYFAVTAGAGCVSRAGAWTRVQARGGPLDVRARLSLAGALRRSRDCRG